MPSLSKLEFEMIEGAFHDGLGTYAELMLANQLIKTAQLDQPLFDLSQCQSKMHNAIARFPAAHPQRETLENEIIRIRVGIEHGALALLDKTGSATLGKVRYVAKEVAGAKAADLILEFTNHPQLPISVKTDKSGKVAVAEGQTPDIGAKWAARYFNVSEPELNQIIYDLGFPSMSEMKRHYLNVAKFVAQVLIRKLGLTDCRPTDFSKAKVSDILAARHLFHQLLRFKKGSDGSQVIIFDRNTGYVKWESLLDGVDIYTLSNERISFRPSRPRANRPIGSEFGIKIDGKAVVTFQIKHKRGAARETDRRSEFSDITTRLII
ncbi:MAG: hypothetical protein KF868_17625 [Acidobacteria bacterium]|nr:hypothetical protein [Acidobacteriota bacterium]MCW5968155.1 hypothetical protein [Blastocatellales bacterium]